MGYYQVPIDTLERKEALEDWAQKALRVAERKADK
jgi:TfoX/Sxy family transcriptional regulator of competence genes